MWERESDCWRERVTVGERVSVRERWEIVSVGVWERE